MKELIRRLSKVSDSSVYYEPKREKKVPEGHVPVHVGDDVETMERFVISVELLSRPIFLELLQKAAQEYGYEQKGVLRIPCPVPVFRRVLEFLDQC